MPLTLPVYTVDMLHDFPQDGNRYELLEGFLIVTPSPTPPHQIVATRLVVAIEPYLARAGLAHAVCGGEIERAPNTHLEPDLLVFPASAPLVSRPGEPADQRARDVLRWHPPEMPAPLHIDLLRLFDGLD